MGVPKFYRWISERYPCLSEVVKEYQIPEFDNLYLDMNGIVHTCSHPNDDDVHFRISEEKIIADIFHYLEALFRLIRPRKVFFMAIDGVAPRAKMNQQRGRRFRSAKEAEDKEKEALRKGEVLPEEKRFDSNCITPGTVFMAKLQEQLDYFVHMKISTDPLWQKTQVILSGHQVPGEGEHKIMEFIRYQKSQPDYNVDTRHCLYGLDADLMMLGLCSHEPYFSLLREEVKFGGKKNEKRVTTPEETTFHLLHLSLLREYLDLEFSALKTVLPFPYDLERVIDDWVLMGFLVGNDFIPHLPHFHINKGALPMLYATYMEVLPILDGYINENGELNLARFETFLAKLSQIDYDHFNDVFADTKWLESRHGRKQLIETAESNTKPISEKPLTLPNNGRSSDTMSFLLAKAAEVEDLLKESSKDSDDASYGAVEEIELADQVSSLVEEEYDEEKQFQAEFKAHKRNYYMEKLEYSEVDGDVLRDQAEGYVRAIQWILHYYYNGVCSWSWFYPHHYAPYVSDIKNFSTLELTYELDQPFLPYEQLLAVLPAASKELLPQALRSLMVSANSPIIEFYPCNFLSDKNGKQQEWEAVVLIPFIDEKRLMSAIKDCESHLTDQERDRNQHGPMQIYVYTDKDSGRYDAPAYFPPVIHNHCHCQKLPREVFVVPPVALVHGIHPRFNLNCYIPGFPSMRHLAHKATLKKSSVCVFHMNTLNESQIVSLLQDTVPDLDVVARRICGQIVFVGWPHLVEARVVAVANNQVKYNIETNASLEGISKNDIIVTKLELTTREVDDWRASERDIRNRYANRWGIDIGQTNILLYATPIVGRKYIYTQNGRVTLEKQWSTISSAYAYQATVKNITVKELHGSQYLTLSEVFPTDSTCFMLGDPGYGLQGRVLSADKKWKGKVRIEFENIHENDSEELKKRWLSTTTYYVPGFTVAQRLGISPHLVSRITGTIFLYQTPSEDDTNSNKARRPRKINVGLNLKFNKQNEEVPGWSRKAENGWQYSMKTVDVLKRYICEFPDFFDFLSRHANGSDDFSDVDIFGEENGVERGAKLHEFIETLPCFKADRQSCGAAAIETETLPQLLKHPIKQMKLKTIIMQVRPHLLYKPDSISGSCSPDPSSNYHLLDRIVNVRQGYSVPLGYRGTVIGIKNALKIMDVVYEVLFDKEFSGGLPVRGVASSPLRVYHLPAWAMINLSHGKRQLQERERQGKPTAVVRPSANAQTQQQPPEATNKNQPRQSYKTAVEQPVKSTVQPKLLTRSKNNAPVNSNGASAAVVTTKPGLKVAPNPASLPTPFLDIWNSLIQQHQQSPDDSPQIENGQTIPSSKVVKEERKSKSKPSSVPSAPKLPSLQEAARNLPKVSKPNQSQKPSAPLMTPTTNVSSFPSIPIPIGTSFSVEQLFGIVGGEMCEKDCSTTKLMSAHSSANNVGINVSSSSNLVSPFGPPTDVHQPAHIPVGASLSVEQLFGIAGEMVERESSMPAFPPPSHCIQLLDTLQHKGLGIPVYNYLPLSEGEVIAEVSLSMVGVIGRSAGKTKSEAAELAAKHALQQIPLIQPVPQYLPNFSMPHPPGINFGTMNRAPVPSSFVPMQVTRQSAQHHPKTHPPSTPQKQQPQQQPQQQHQAQNIPEQVTNPHLIEKAFNPVVSDNSVQSKLLTAKPPGSRLAIRFNGP